MTDLAKRITKLQFTTSEEVHEKGQYRKLVIEAKPGFAVLRASGLRTAYTISWSAVWSMAVKAAVAAEKAEKKAKGKR